MKNLRRRLSPIRSYKQSSRQAGFTLIELMIVVAIIGIISAVAFPSYTSYMKKSRRADAKVALTKMADAQERWYLQNRTYTDDVDEVGGATSPDGNYTLAVTAASDAELLNGFEITATATAAQADDTTCAVFTLASTGAKTATNTNCW